MNSAAAVLTGDSTPASAADSLAGRVLEAPHAAPSSPGQGAGPLERSPYGRPADHDEGAIGARMLGLTTTLSGRLLSPAQVEVHRLLDDQLVDGSPTALLSAVQVPRRAGKTTALLALAVGRCVSRPGYQVGYSAQSGVKSRERFRDLHELLARHAPPGWRAVQAKGEERIEWPSGSVIRFYPPKPGNWRGDATDLGILDESQEHDRELAEELLGAVLPTMDTRPTAQLVVAGTAGKSRDGLLWQGLEYGRAGTWGLLNYAADPAADPDDPETWKAAHPGIGHMTPLAAIERNHSMLPADEFAREYLGQWPDTLQTMALTAEVWQQAGTEHVQRPAHFGVGIDVAPDRSDAAIVAAWRVGGVGYVEVIEQRAGALWVRDRALTLARTYGVGLGYDAMGPVLVVADELARARPRPHLNGLTTAEFTTACAALVGGVIDGNVKHFRDPVLSDAVLGAGRRQVGDRWAFSRTRSDVSITTLVAAAVALRQYDAAPQAAAKPRLRSVRAGAPLF